mmetsp:Transcript_57395/g.124735  ORF Transcript_57395/g.124735 Transcript_57395/m.124735 type:complete len:246 (-) Transcript_57395:151-888(-)|eukprot:1625216-Pleurochrysis_carterae.AAC.8
MSEVIGPVKNELELPSPQAADVDSDSDVQTWQGLEDEICAGNNSTLSEAEVAYSSDEPSVDMLSDQFIAQQAQELQALRAEIETLKTTHAQTQRKRAAEARAAREQRIAAFLAEWLPEKESIHSDSADVINDRPPSEPVRTTGTVPISTRPTAAVATATSALSARRPASAGRGTSSTGGPLGKPTLSSAAFGKPMLPKPKAPIKLAPAAAALAAGMIDSPYNRPNRLMAAAASASAAAKTGPTRR